MASIRQLATGLPSRWTVQAPQSPVPQPSFGPGEPQVLAQGVEQGVVGLDEHLDGLVVHGAAQELFGHGDPSSGSGARARERGRSACDG